MTLKRFKYDKLVRDKTPEIVIKAGARAEIRILGDEEYIAKLKDKLLEETLEVLDAKNNEELQEELGDVLEVMMCLAKMHNIKFEDVIKQAAQKKQENGGFENRVYCEYVEIDSNHQYINYYKKKSEKYPEILTIEE